MTKGIWSKYVSTIKIFRFLSSMKIFKYPYWRHLRKEDIGARNRKMMCDKHWCLRTK